MYIHDLLVMHRSFVLNLHAVANDCIVLDRSLLVLVQRTWLIRFTIREAKAPVGAATLSLTFSAFQKAMFANDHKIFERPRSTKNIVDFLTYSGFQHQVYFK